MCSKNNKSVQIIQESFVVYDMTVALTPTSDTLKAPLLAAIRVFFPLK